MLALKIIAGTVLAGVLLIAASPWLLAMRCSFGPQVKKQRKW